MIQPLVCAVMLTRDRPEMARRAVECFRAQTYDPTRRFLCILDTSTKAAWLTRSDDLDIGHDWRPSMQGETIGALRNFANQVLPEPDIFVHWDDDDWSNPRRIEEQVFFLMETGAEVVGYDELLFWRTPAGQAWLYRAPKIGPPPGTTLCYWRQTWRRKAFPAKHVGEDYDWCRNLNVAMAASMIDPLHADYCEPPMIASIHGANTNASAYDLESYVARGSREWKQLGPEWADYCRKVMETPK